MSRLLDALVIHAMQIQLAKLFSIEIILTIVHANLVIVEQIAKTMISNVCHIVIRNPSVDRSLVV